MGISLVNGLNQAVFMVISYGCWLMVDPVMAFIALAGLGIRIPVTSTATGAANAEDFWLGNRKSLESHTKLWDLFVAFIWGGVFWIWFGIDI